MAIKMYLPVALALAACPVAAHAAQADDHAVPRPGALETYGDWTVACDNVKRCTMASLGTNGGAFPDVTMEIARDAGPGGGYEIALASAAADTPAPTAFTIDGRRFAVAGNALTGAAARGVAAAVAKGRALTVRDAKARRLGSVSLTGAAAALRYIDAQQGRAGTVTATVATGQRPAATVPRAAALPRVAAIAFTRDAAAPDATQTAAMRRVAQCEEHTAGWKPRAHALADGATLVLVPCSAGAYNEIDALFVLRGGKAVPARADAPTGFDASGADSRTPVRSVINGDVDGGVLTSYAKGRGLGDCGVRQSFAWDGTQLRLVEQREMGECRGNPDYLTLWRAATVRR